MTYVWYIRFYRSNQLNDTEFVFYKFMVIQVANKLPVLTKLEGLLPHLKISNLNLKWTYIDLLNI